MAAWYVKYLLENSDSIKSNIVKQEGFETVVFDFDDDLYDDLLTVEICVSNLLKNNLLTEREHDVIKKIKSGMNYADISRAYGTSARYVYYLVSTVTDRIAFSLGGYFPNDGFYEYMIEKYNLNESEELILKKLLGVN